MRPIEAALLAGSGVVVVLQSRTARTAAVRGAVRAGRAAAPVAARAAGRARQSATARYSGVRAAWADRSPARPIGCLDPECTWTQDRPSSAELLEHLRTAHRAPSEPAPAGAPPQTAPAAEAPARRLRPVPAPAERITEVAPGVKIARQITNAIDKIGSNVDEFRAAARALNAAGEVEPTGLLQLLEALTGVMTTVAGTASLITNIAEHADVEMWVDLRAVAPLYEAASGVMTETETIRRAMDRIRQLYAEEIEVERKREEQVVRPLNPALAKTA